MALSGEEKGIIEEALGIYLQVVAQQLPRQQVQQLAATAQTPSVPAAANRATSRPAFPTNGIKASVSPATSFRRRAAPTR
jgi:hypothetical protein